MYPGHSVHVTERKGKRWSTRWSGTTGVRQTKVDNILTSFIKRTCIVFAMHDFSLYTREGSTWRQKKGNFFVPFLLPLPWMRKVSLTPVQSGASGTFFGRLAVKAVATFQLKESPLICRFSDDQLFSWGCLELQPCFIYLGS